MEITEFKTETSTEYTIQDGIFTLRHFDFVDGAKHNEATKRTDEGFEFVSTHSDEIKPLFIALHNYKNQ